MVESYLPPACECSEVFAAYQNDELTGVYVLYRESDQDYEIKNYEIKSYEIKNIAVAEDHQGKGIGYAMLLHAIEACVEKGAESLTICTGNTSSGQIALYKKAGFIIQNIEKGYFLQHYSEPIYENGERCEDRVMMARQIP